MLMLLHTLPLCHCEKDEQRRGNITKSEKQKAKLKKQEAAFLLTLLFFSWSVSAVVAAAPKSIIAKKKQKAKWKKQEAARPL